MAQAFLLGLSNGAVCLAYCAPVLIPYLLGRGEGIRKNGGIVLHFLLGRLLGYLLFGIMAWAFTDSLLQAVGYRELILGSAYVVLSALLIFYGFFDARPPSCAAPRFSRLSSYLGQASRLIPIAAGIATGFSFCPPFLLVLTGATEEASLTRTVLFFFAFFLGTSVFFLPAPFFGMLKSIAALKTVGKMAAGVMGIYYFYSGIVMVAGGIKSL
ncbi:MAG: hypothetical protein A4E57_01036 [Syntrophorhabdaceae bacterium PtaU1.Bin034]|nr:MAG: hypothetical protein A4E57_01036 [Syntrophorhabdaceae bacterium PtaU1.Bin034]